MSRVVGVINDGSFRVVDTEVNEDPYVYVTENSIINGFITFGDEVVATALIDYDGNIQEV